MIKGVNRQVVEVQETDCDYFERILFFVKPEYASLSEGKIRERASLIAGKTSAALFGRVKNEGRCLVDWRCQRAAGILFVIAVYNKRSFLIRMTHMKLLPIKGLQKPISAGSWLLPRRIWALQD